MRARFNSSGFLVRPTDQEMAGWSDDELARELGEVARELGEDKSAHDFASLSGAHGAVHAQSEYGAYCVDLEREARRRRARASQAPESVVQSRTLADELREVQRARRANVDDDVGAEVHRLVALAHRHVTAELRRFVGRDTFPSNQQSLRVACPPMEVELPARTKAGRDRQFEAIRERAVAALEVLLEADALRVVHLTTQRRYADGGGAELEFTVEVSWAGDAGGEG